MGFTVTFSDMHMFFVHNRLPFPLICLPLLLVSFLQCYHLSVCTFSVYLLLVPQRVPLGCLQECDGWSCLQVISLYTHPDIESTFLHRAAEASRQGGVRWTANTHPHASGDGPRSEQGSEGLRLLCRRCSGGPKKTTDVRSRGEPQGEHWWD